jgi:DNA replication protein DnaC
VTLDTVLPRTDLHPKQCPALELMKNCPRDSYVFSGEPGTGKTHFFWALYRRACEDINRRVVACSMLQLIEQYREAFRPRRDEEPAPRALVMPNDLQQTGIAYSLFLDDIDKPRMTEYVAEQIHALLDAAYVHEHQVVVTTNLRVREPDQLSAHFERADERYGRAIVRRIVHPGNNLVEFF